MIRWPCDRCGKKRCAVVYHYESGWNVQWICGPCFLQGNEVTDLERAELRARRAKAARPPAKGKGP